MDPSVIQVLKEAVIASPDNAELRLHLADLLLQAQHPSEALGHSIHVLGLDPTHLRALDIAIAAARATGDDVRAAAWTRLANGLRRDEHSEAGEPAAAPDQQVPLDTMGYGEYSEDGRGQDLDTFLDELLGEITIDPAITLADVAGLEDVKHRLNASFLLPMRNEEMRQAYGKSLRGGLLLYGPPGCGKTFLARAVAGELGAHFFAIGLHDVLDMWLGKSESNLHKIFETARRRKPCVLFFDEVDALGFKRSNLTRSAGRNVVVQLLTELDSIGSENEGVFVLGATNQPWDVDPALRRPGRFDRTVLVLPPDTQARAAIISYNLRDRPTGDVDLSRLAALTDGFSGADLRLLCEGAVELAMEEAMRAGRVVPVTMTHLERAGRAIRPSTRPWFETANNYALFANTSGEYDDLLSYIKRRRLV